MTTLRGFEDRAIAGVQQKRLLINRRTLILIGMDAFIMLMMEAFCLLIYSDGKPLQDLPGFVLQGLLGVLLMLLLSIFFKAYRQVWRYANAGSYARLIFAHALSGISLYMLGRLFHFSEFSSLEFIITSQSLTVLACFSYRLLYQCAVEYSARRIDNTKCPFCRYVVVRRGSGDAKNADQKNKIKIAIVGAGRIGAMLAEELRNNPNAIYEPCCFIETSTEKVGREIKGIPVLSEKAVSGNAMEKLPVQEIVFALPNIGQEKLLELYEQYKKTGCKVKVYDFPLTQAVQNGRRTMRDFDVEELLFRKPTNFINNRVAAFYQNKVILISGGGGSIGSELCRQIGKMHPKRIVVLDIYENNAYELQQELKIAYGSAVDLKVEIASVQDAVQMEKVFQKYHPQIVLHAAAHKHVPLMEDNAVEAVKNNIFGTYTIVNLSEQYGVEKFIMISTDKAVNPTNVMGATKRFCEMIIQSKTDSKTCFSATRFGNVLGSNGSVIPLFKRQIESGGPITITDKRIIRYFMTIPEASQLVLESGAMAEKGEVYVLDMGKPVKILDLAETMVRLSGLEPYRDIDIVETGLRPGEKLYEELLIQKETTHRTENNMIFVEQDYHLANEELSERLKLLQKSVQMGDNDAVRIALREVVPTYRAAENEIPQDAAQTARRPAAKRTKSDKAIA